MDYESNDLNALNTFHNPEESRIERLMKDYRRLILLCDTEPQRMAQKINGLTEEAIKWERRADRWRSKHIKAERVVGAYEQSLQIWKDDYNKLCKKLKAEKNKSIFVLIKERFIEWLLG